MSASSNYATTPNVGGAVIVSALTGTRAIPIGASTLITAGASGTIVTRAIIQNVSPVAAGAPTALNVAVFYLYDGATYYMIREFEFAALNASAVLASGTFEVLFNDLVIPTGWSLRAGLTTCAASNIDETCITAFGGDF